MVYSGPGITVCRVQSSFYCLQSGDNAVIYVRSYNSVSMSLANLIMEIKDPSLFVNGFVQQELNQLANFISTM